MFDREVGRFSSTDYATKIFQLNDVQQKVLDSIQEQFSPKLESSMVRPSSPLASKVESLKLEGTKFDIESEQSEIDNPKSAIAKDVVLLHGVTSSGKTEIYVRLIEQALAEGKQVLYLLPEIALTTQIINRLRKYFGDIVGVYHSKFNTNERVEIWNAVLSPKLKSPKSKVPSSKLGDQSDKEKVESQKEKEVITSNTTLDFGPAFGIGLFAA